MKLGVDVIVHIILRRLINGISVLKPVHDSRLFAPISGSCPFQFHRVRGYNRRKQVQIRPYLSMPEYIVLS